MHAARLLTLLLFLGVFAGCGGADSWDSTSTCDETTGLCGETAADVELGPPASVSFVSFDTGTIALKGTGGVDRQEHSKLTFQVFDAGGHSLANQPVEFVFADTNRTDAVGGLKLTPESASTDANGKVAVVVSAGTIPTSIRVKATVRGTTVAALSNVLVVSTGIPDQRHFSLAAKTGNCEGLNFDQTCTEITVTLGDHFSNPVADGTVVNFTAEGGVIDASCITGSVPPGNVTSPAGQTCSVTLRASNPRPLDGRVTVLAYVVGEENFFDANGNNVCDGCLSDGGAEFSAARDDLPLDIFRNDDESFDGLGQTWTPGEPCIGPNSTQDCRTPGDGVYNGVLATPKVTSPQTLYVSDQLVVVFSGSDALTTFSPASLTCPANGTASTTVTVRDVLGNMMPAGTKVKFGATFGGLGVNVDPGEVNVENIVLGVGAPVLVSSYPVTVPCPATGGAGVLKVTVTTPNGVVSTATAPIN